MSPQRNYPKTQQRPKWRAKSIVGEHSNTTDNPLYRATGGNWSVARPAVESAATPRDVWRIRAQRAFCLTCHTGDCSRRRHKFKTLKQINYELKEGALQCFSQTHTHLPEEDSLHPLLVLNKLVSRLRAGTSVGSPEISGANACRASQLAPTASFTLTSASVATTGPEARAIGHLG